MHLAAWVAVLALAVGHVLSLPRGVAVSKTSAGTAPSDARFRWIRVSQQPSPVFLARVQLRELSRSEVHPAGALAATFRLRWRGWQGTRG